MANEARTYPSELPVVPLRQTVVFPLTLQPLAISRPMSVESVNRALAADRLLFLSLQTGDKDEPRALARQSQRYGPSDAARRAGDDDYFIGDDSGAHRLDYIE